MKKLTLYSVLFITTFAFLFILFVALLLLPISNESKNILSRYTTATNDPKNFNYGVNINTGIPYYVNTCFFNNTFNYFSNSRIVVIHSSYENKSNSEYTTAVDIFRYERKLNFWSIDFVSVESAILDGNFDELKLKSDNFCKIEQASFHSTSAQEILQLKSDAINNPKQQVPESTLTQEQIRQQIEEQEKDDSSR